MGAFTIPAGSGTANFNTVSVSGAANWSFADGLSIGLTGAGNAFNLQGEGSINIIADVSLTIRGGTGTSTFGSTTYSFAFDETTGVITQTGRIQKNIVSATDDATAAIDCAVTDIYELTAMANATTFSVTGTPLNGQTLIVRLKDNGTARALTWGSEFASKGATLPTTTVLGKQHYVGFVYNSASSKWECIMATVEA